MKIRTLRTISLSVTALLISGIISGCSAGQVSSGGTSSASETTASFSGSAVSESSDESLSVSTEEEPAENSASDTVAEPVSEPSEGVYEETISSAEKPSESEEESPAEASGSMEGGESAYVNPYYTGELIYLDQTWKNADHSVINSGAAVMYCAVENRRNIIIGVNAGHGTGGVDGRMTLCHPDGSPKVTGGTTGEGSTEAIAVSSGMEFYDGTPERDVTLAAAQILRDKLLANGYDVLMLRDGEDVQLDNVARTVICNNITSCHIALHWDGDGRDYDKGCFYMGVPDGIKAMDPVSGIWQQDEALGAALIEGLRSQGIGIYEEGRVTQDLTQTSYSSIPSVDIELGNAASDHSTERLNAQMEGLLAGINLYFQS